MVEEKKEFSDVVFIGEKPFVNYLRSIELLLRTKNMPKIFIKARGKHMNKAIDLAEASKNKFCKDLDLKIGKVEISTENFEKEGKEFSVSCIEIVLNR